MPTLFAKTLRSQIKQAKSKKDLQLFKRLTVLLAVAMGKPIGKVADYHNVSVKSVNRWIKKYQIGGVDGLVDADKSGRKPKLTEGEMMQLKDFIVEDKERVWVARHVLNTIMILFSVAYSVSYLPQLLRKLGLSFHKAVHYLERRNPEKRREWIQERLPKIYERHIKDGWRIFYQDEVGFQTEGTLTYSWFLQGKSIEIKNKGRHGRINVIGAYELGSGAFFYKITKLKVNALRFKRFVCSMKKHYGSDKILLICDNASFHKAKWFTAWWEAYDGIALEFLPAYSPDFNPIERLWKWIKKEFTHNKCWRTKEALERHLSLNLIEVVKHPETHIGCMRAELMELKKAFEYYDTPFPCDDLLPQAA